MNRDGQVTTDDHGPVIDILAWFLMVAMILTVIFRLVTRTILTHSSGADDGIICVSLVLGIGQVVAVSLGVKNGLGRRMKSLSNRELVSFEQALYASDILYIMALALAKISVLYLLKRLTSKAKHRYYILVLSGTVMIWACAAVLALIFQCGRGHPWNGGTQTCIPMVAFWDAIGIFDILTEFLIMAQSIWLIWDLQMPLRIKTVVVGAFLPRIIIPITIIFRLVCLRVAFNASDRTFHSVASSICTQCEICFSIVTACIPVTKPFLNGFASGMLGNSFRHQIPQGAQATEHSMHTLVNRPHGYYHTESGVTKANHRGPDSKLGSSAAAVGPESTSAKRVLKKRPSISSTRSDQMIISRTDQWTVHYENRSKQSNESLNWPLQAGHSAV